MIPGGGGSIVNTASIAAFSGGAAGLAYSAAKAAIVNLTMTSAAELGPRGIRVNVVAPGLIATAMAAGVPDTAVHWIVHELQPLHTVGLAEHVADAIAWLASAEAGFVTGEAIKIDGGIAAAGTRMLDALDPDGAAMHHAGFGHGSTGRPMTLRPV
jgi:NAD(P)-dependent dehydrogenase (short-subunit alcohol dehydrogenase family)